MVRSVISVLGYLRACISVVVVIVVGFPFALLLERSRSPITILLMPELGLATLLGLLTFASLFLVRGSHFVVGVIFYGGLACMMFVNLVTQKHSAGQTGMRTDSYMA
ncbi:MAG: hypothetical protein HY288_00220 [Planctomycetia bacterium]|nr:hypothetical protein [Planctomycetia bacterium]